MNPAQGVVKDKGSIYPGSGSSDLATMIWQPAILIILVSTYHHVCSTNEDNDEQDI